MAFEHGIDGVTPIVNGPMTVAAAVNNANRLVTDATERIYRIFCAGYNAK